jgi:hypothetical protein
VLARIANGINRAVDRNPGEVFLIEGYTEPAPTSDETNGDGGIVAAAQFQPRGRRLRG